MLFRRELELGRSGVRAVAAPLALCTLPLGALIAPAAQVAALVALLVVALTLEKGTR